MADMLTTTANVEIAGILHFAEDRSSVRKIVTKMLDGKPAVQTIGNAMQMFNISFHALKSGRDTLNELCTTGASLKLVYHDKVYLGIIEDEEINWSFVFYNDGKDWATGTFTLLVQEEIA